MCINMELCVAFPVVVFVLRIFVYKILEGFTEKDLQDNFQLVEHLNVAICHIITLLRPDCCVYIFLYYHVHLNADSCYIITSAVMLNEAKAEA